ncbi:cobyric acid synthase [Methylobacterium sp. WL30]|uniref:cobyric acid synthase n=1 Tax=unclassified Methylobacterium TaxID=2615210 RepID=UPI0011CC3AB6|nr:MULTISPECIES: cobyric acid synthase [unclassified Methylobacterium]TXN25877.1 cobyric acid synthase [Methylobacterium sp. WL93]TXN45469.1 cobyric acid synthase [Methylobacterium sp. WL119]TXN65962.1 cobyric acid synthase [Methylobacterium sp. WL30]
MIQGTGSDVGKSLIVAGLARAFTRRGLRVRPFKPQNMSNNAAVTTDGGEIGRAQALQARAAGVAPSIHMNPVLLKPQTEVGSQVVVQGRMVATVKARDYQAWKPRLLAAVLDSFDRLRTQADLILVEGAGSASEVNLRAGDIANMGFARATDTPVVLLGDIDRGGVIASLVGTKAVIDPDDAAMIVGFLVNRFRGDPSLFSDGMDLIARHTGWASLGLIPHFPEAARLPAEDVLGLVGSAGPAATRIAVPVFPRIANFDDLDPLRAEPAVEVVLVRPGEAIPGDAALVLLPGSKTTIDDLEFVRAQGWDVDLHAHLRRGGRVLGLCGGYQMLGRTLSDPDGIEGEARTVRGLGLLAVDTVMTPLKRLEAVSGTSLPDGMPFTGYEMHVGDTTGADAERPLLRLADGRADGAVSADGLVSGTYVHGLFADDRQRAAWLARLGARSDGASYEAGIERVLDALAAHLEQHVDCDRLLALAR